MKILYPIAFFLLLPLAMWLGGYLAEHLPDYYEEMLYGWLYPEDAE